MSCDSDRPATSVRRIVPNLPSPEPGGGHRFYTDVLGLEVAMDLGWIVTYAAPGDRNAQVSVIRADATAPVRPDVSVEVDDVDAAHAAACHLGAEIAYPLTDEPWGVRRFFVRDSGGTIINVLSHR